MEGNTWISVWHLGAPCWHQRSFLLSFRDGLGSPYFNQTLILRSPWINEAPQCTKIPSRAWNPLVLRFWHFPMVWKPLSGSSSRNWRWWGCCIPADASPVEISQLLSDLSTETKWKEKNPQNLTNKQTNHKKKQTKPNKTLKNLKTNKKPLKKLQEKLLWHELLLTCYNISGEGGTELGCG